MFYVLEGALTVRLGEDTVQLESGGFVCVPPGVKHTFRNPSERAVRFLNLSTPAGWEGYVRDLGRTRSLQLRLSRELSSCDRALRADKRLATTRLGRQAGGRFA
jgi:uncharacterized cupin superfamily protein